VLANCVNWLTDQLIETHLWNAVILWARAPSSDIAYSFVGLEQSAWCRWI
jgi:hypothetical protein